MRKQRSYRWTLGDILDYEVLLAREADSDSGTEESRKWHLSYSGNRRPRHLLHAWVLSRRHQPSARLPGITAERLYRATGAGLILLGLLTGTGLGWGLLAYAGSDAVNLLLTLALLIGVPFLMTAVSFALNILPLRRNNSYRVVDRLVRVLNRVVGFNHRLGFLDKGQADALVGGLSHFREHATRYSGIARWMVSVPVQLRAVSFHAGLLVAVFWRGIVQDLAFGWQTTLRVTAADIHKLAFDIAWPWRTLVPVPTPAQVEGSRVVLKEGLAGLENSNLISWWPYICCAILAYGVLPRLALLFYAVIRRRISSLNLSFSDGRSRRIIAILETEPGRNQLPTGRIAPVLHSIPENMKFTVLYPSIRTDLSEREPWLGFISKLWKADLSDLHPVTLDDEDDKDILASLTGLRGKKEGVLVVFEGWRPYTAAAALYIDSVQSVVPSGVPVVVVLTGRPGNGFSMRDEDRGNIRQWENLLPAAVQAGSCEIVELRSFE